MNFAAITKDAATLRVSAHLKDYAATRAEFSWEAIRRELDGLPEARGLNMAHEAVDRHASGPRAQHPALRWLGKDGTVRDISYGELARGSASHCAARFHPRRDQAA